MKLKDNKKLKIKGKKVFKNGAVGAYVYYNKEKKWKWRIIKGPKKKNIMKGGYQHEGPPFSSGNGVLDHIAGLWWWNYGNYVWWTDGQDGYYFLAGSQPANNDNKQTHLHIYNAGHVESKGYIWFEYIEKVRGRHLHSGSVTENTITDVMNEIDKICNKLWYFHNNPTEEQEYSSHLFAKAQ